MSSKANAPRRNGLAKRFAKDWKRLERSGRYPMQELKDVMQLLIENRRPLPPQYHDHPLRGDWIDHRDCHIRGDDKNGRGDDDLLLLFGQKPVELVGKSRAVGGVRRRRPAGTLACAAQLIEVVP